jgi:hypothetical protein
MHNFHWKLRFDLNPKFRTVKERKRRNQFDLLSFAVGQINLCGTSHFSVLCELWHLTCFILAS